MLACYRACQPNYDAFQHLTSIKFKKTKTFFLSKYFSSFFISNYALNIMTSDVSFGRQN
jgi:hypothetical protein